MDFVLPDLAVALGDVARRAMADAGGLDLGRRAFDQPALRQSVVEPLIEELAWRGLEVRSDAASLFAGGTLCREAGAVAFPYPVPALLAASRSTAHFVMAVDGEPAWADHGDLSGPWVAVDTDGGARWAEALPTPRNRTMGPFVERMALGAQLGSDHMGDLVLLTVLDCWRVLGALEAAHGLALGHVGDRRQFGRALSEFQGVQFHVADAAVALRGLRQLAYFTTWRTAQLGVDGFVDALALRSYAIEVARTVLCVSQLLHGAVGFCAEHDLSVLQRSVQSSLRLPTDLARTNELLVAAIDGQGFDGLFRHAPATVGGKGDH